MAPRADYHEVASEKGLDPLRPQLQADLLCQELRQRGPKAAGGLMSVTVTSAPRRRRQSAAACPLLPRPTTSTLLPRTSVMRSPWAAIGHACEILLLSVVSSPLS